MKNTSSPAFEATICVPRNARGTRSLDFGVSDSENVVEWVLTEAENASLAATYHDINDKVGTIVDYCEDEVILFEHLPAALGLVEANEMRSTDAEERSGLVKLGEALRLAQECGTCVWLFL